MFTKAFLRALMVAVATAMLVFTTMEHTREHPVDGWLNISPDPTEHIISLAGSAESESLLAGTQSGRIFVSGDRGGRWRAAFPSPPDGAAVRQILQTRPAGTSYAATAAGVFQSGTSDDEWRPLTAATAANPVGTVLSLDQADTLLTGSSEGIALSEDQGQTWIAADWPANLQAYHLLSWEDRLWAGTIGDGVYVSENRGFSWSPHNTGLPGGIYVFDLLPVPGAGLWTATNQGVFQQTSLEDPWQPVGTRLHGRRVLTLAMDTAAPTIWAGTDNGVWRFPLGTAAESEGERPDEAAIVTLDTATTVWEPVRGPWGNPISNLIIHRGEVVVAAGGLYVARDAPGLQPTSLLAAMAAGIGVFLLLGWRQVLWRPK